MQLRLNINSATKLTVFQTKLPTLEDCVQMRSVVPTLGLFNHGCDCNTHFAPISSDILQSDVYFCTAWKTIEPGTELTVQYGPPDRYDRQYLLDHFGFRCKCERCVRETRDAIDGVYYPVACGNCRGLLTRDLHLENEVSPF